MIAHEPLKQQAEFKFKQTRPTSWLWTGLRTALRLKRNTGFLGSRFERDLYCNLPSLFSFPFLSKRLMFSPPRGRMCFLSPPSQPRPWKHPDVKRVIQDVQRGYFIFYSPTVHQGHLAKPTCCGDVQYKCNVCPFLCLLGAALGDPRQVFLIMQTIVLGSRAANALANNPKNKPREIDFPVPAPKPLCGFTCVCLMTLISLGSSFA